MHPQSGSERRTRGHKDVKRQPLLGAKLYVEPATIFVRETMSTPVGQIAAPFLSCPWPTQGMHRTPKLQGEQLSHQQVHYNSNKFLALLLLRNTINIWEGSISPTNIVHIIMYSGRHCATGRHYSTTIVDIAVVNSIIIYNIVAYQNGFKAITENDYRDTLVLQIISKYGRDKTGETKPGRPYRSDRRVKYGSQVFDVGQKSRCQYCYLNGHTFWTQRKCWDCPFQPTLCHTVNRDCHAKWHSPNFDTNRDLWIKQKESVRVQQAQSTEQTQPAMQTRGRGCPTGSHKHSK